MIYEPSIRYCLSDVIPIGVIKNQKYNYIMKLKCCNYNEGITQAVFFLVKFSIFSASKDNYCQEWNLTEV